MYLKSIEVQGFKSFANKITFEFHNGITGIVGPNGSGISNVADAVRWVLGEQSAKQLRGGNMQDVIFSGTETRKPLGFAYVAITLDNSDHNLPIDYEEVTIARRLYRSGESEYLMNGVSCRLKDVNELFYDTGIGKEGYSIIGQGQIDKILSGKPEERRELFDEAAGIVKFKRRKAASLKKLEEEQQNLTRVNDILSELTRQLAPLEKQSETAKIYLKKREELKALDVRMFLAEMERINAQLKEIEEKSEIVRQDLEKTGKDFETTKTEYEALEKELEAFNVKIEVFREESTKKALEKQQLEGQINVAKEQISSAKQSDLQYRERVEALEAELKQREESEKLYTEEKAELDAKIDEIRQKEETAKNLFRDFAFEIHELEEQLEEDKSEIIEILNHRGSTKGKMQRYDAMMEQISLRKTEFNQKYLRLKSETAKQEEEKERFEKEQQEIDAEILGLTKKSNKNEDEITRYQSLLGKSIKEQQVLQNDYHKEASRLESLRNITERYDGYGNSIRRVMEQKKRVPGIHGVVADLIKVEKNYETAIETALGGSIQNIVTDNETTAKQMISFLKQNKYGRATFLPLTSMGAGRGFSTPSALKEPGVVGVASELVSTEVEYERLIEYLLGRTLVVENIDFAIAIARKYKYSLRMVTIEGESLNPGGSMTGGAFKNNSNLLGRRREIEELETRVESLKNQLEAKQKEIDTYREKRNFHREEAGRLNAALQEQSLKDNTLRMNQKAMEQKAKEIAKEYTDLKRDLAALEKQTQEIEENRESIRVELETSDKREAQLEDQINQNQEKLDEKKKQENAHSKELEELHLENAELSSKQGFAKENLERILSEKKNLQRQLMELAANVSDAKDEIEKKEAEIEKMQEAVEAAKAQEAEDEAKLQEYLAKKESMNQSHKGFFEKRDELSGRMNLLDKDLYRLENQKEKLEENQENQIGYMWEEYEMTYSAAKEQTFEEPLERSEIKKAQAEVRNEIKKLGNVNVNAIEEYKELSERHTFLNAQHEDLVEAEKTLLKIIDELDIGMRHQFEEKFAQIREEFDKAFKELFGGGKGTIELDEEEDILEAGIRIISQPPGKKLQNMMQLSGGEKALTAIALLFAIQNLKPSPFCLLDEIEAALDDSNVTRYARYLHKLTKNTQFIIITHRRGTMTAADRLYGITMQEKGVSTLVSVNLIENDLDK